MEAASEDPYVELIGAVLLVPTPDEPAVPGVWERVEREVLSMLMVEDETGLLAPAFTSVEALGRWKADGGAYVEREAAWLFELVAGDPDGRVTVDPGSDAAVVLGPSEVAALAQGRLPGASAQVLISTPADPLPAPVHDAVRAAGLAEPAALSGRLLQLDVGSERQLVVFVDLAPSTSEADVSAIMSRLVDGVAARTPDAAGLRFMVVTPEWRDAYDSGGQHLW